MSDPKSQSLSSHTRWDPIFHFFALPALLILFPIYSIIHLVRHPTPQSVVVLVVAAALAVLVLRARTYPLAVQDRLIGLEERIRLERVLGAPGKDLGNQLSDDQLIGLRFASDGELAELAKACVAEKLPRKEVKKRVKTWRPDHRRA
jgi:hypothetical protein